MKTAISIPDPIFQAADEAAARMSISRSELYARAVEAFLHQQSSSEITERINEVCATENTEVDPLLYDAALRSIEPEPW